GGTLSIVKGGAAAAMRAALQTAAALKKWPADLPPGSRFEITIGIDRGGVHIGWDLNGCPNIWGDAINFSNRISSACYPGQILASASFIDELRSETTELDLYIDKKYLEDKRSQMRLAKHGHPLKVVNLS